MLDHGEEKTASDRHCFLQFAPVQKSFCQGWATLFDVDEMQNDSQAPVA
jgi:hypothetical protein